MEFVQLVDEQDNAIGVMEKMEAHRQSRLHRAISIFVFNSRGELLLQRRAKKKYHSGLLWTNTCCSHPRPEEKLLDACNRRLSEEMGIQCNLEHQFSFVYQVSLDNELSEHELDHVFFGISDLEPIINHDEVSEWRYQSLESIEIEMKNYPQLFTEWFKIILEEYKHHL